MKKFIALIITLVFWISSANAISFEKTLNLDIWVEIYEINQFTLDEYSFKSNALQNAYEELEYLDSAFREAIFDRFQKWEIKRYQAHAFVKEYKTFVYYTNQFFYYLKQTEYGNNSKENSYYIGKMYQNLTDSYQRLSSIIK